MKTKSKTPTPETKAKVCVACANPVSFVPVFDNNEPHKFISDVPFCSNTSCPRFGLLTVITGLDDKDDKAEDTTSK